MLPQVLETARLYSWWEKSQLELRLNGVQPTPLLMDCLDILQGAVNELEGEILAKAQKTDGYR
jgi:hypothetical protein